MRPSVDVEGTIGAMAGGRIRLGLAAISVLVVAGWLAAPASADPAPPPALASFDVSTLAPGYTPNIHDYVVRCNNRAVAEVKAASELMREDAEFQQKLARLCRRYYELEEALARADRTLQIDPYDVRT